MPETRVAVVTGATRGIGHAVALQLARDGYAIAALGTQGPERVQERLQQIQDLGQPVLYVRGDLAQRSDREAFVDRVVSEFGRIDVLVNNAGVAPKERRDILETSEESFDYVLNVNLKGTYFLTQRIANQMIIQVKGALSGIRDASESVSSTDGGIRCRQDDERLVADDRCRGRALPGRLCEAGGSHNDPRTRPVIVNISSVSAYMPSPSRGEYCISKAGLSMVTALFADRLSEYGIVVYEVRPGIISTDMTESVRGKYDQLIAGGLAPMKRWGRPEDVADAVSLLCSGRLRYSTGEIINVDGGMHLRRL